MSYITLSQAQKFLGRLYESAYYNELTDSVEDALLQEDIDSVTAVIDSYVTRAYSEGVTGAQAIAVLRDISEKLLVHKAHQRFDYSNIPDSVIDSQKEATFRLKDIANGKMLLSDEAQAPKSNAFFSSFQGHKPVFTRSSMSFF